MLLEDLSRFNLKDIFKVEEISGGHINKTFKISTNYGNYIAQIINKDVFSSVEAVMSNIAVVCEHLNRKSINVLDYLTTDDGKNYYTNSNGDYIRVCKFLENSKSVEFSNDFNLIYNAGIGFSQFCYGICDIKSSSIIDTIPNFHNTEYYLDRVFNLKDIPSNVDSILNDIYKLKDYSKVVQSFSKQIAHNDTRFNNILFDKNTKSPICVIDLDTIMHGYIAYDFADGVRSICKNKYNKLSMAKFKSFYDGFSSYPVINTNKSVLIDSIISVSLELSSRYLYEYLTQGNYFNLSSKEENLSKAKLNLDFAEDVLLKKFMIQTAL